MKPQKKLYSWLFTCLAIFAVHQVFTNRNTRNNCITAIRRFNARRGMPKLLLSDSSTYSVGVFKQLRSEPINFNKTTITETIQIRIVDGALLLRLLFTLIKSIVPTNLGSGWQSKKQTASIEAEIEAFDKILSADAYQQLYWPRHSNDTLFLYGSSFFLRSSTSLLRCIYR